MAVGADVQAAGAIVKTQLQHNALVRKRVEGVVDGPEGDAG